jgi:heterodisulfide reductase subunit C2
MSAVKSDTLTSLLSEKTGVLLSHCYQCGKCSAGCPVASEMDYSPSLIMRMLQTNNSALLDKVLKSYSIWLCLSCETCFCRCPMDIEIPLVMDYLRQESVARKMINPKARKIVAAHKAFLASIRRTGRLYEVGMLAELKIKTLDFSDVSLAPFMFMKGKLHLLPKKVKDIKAIRKIFMKTKNTGT